MAKERICKNCGRYEDCAKWISENDCCEDWITKTELKKQQKAASQSEQ